VDNSGSKIKFEKAAEYEIEEEIIIETDTKLKLGKK
jgi:hypothetical protein